MARDVKLTGVLLEPGQRAKVERWAGESGGTISDVVRLLIDSVELEIKPTFITKPSGQRAAITVQA